MLGIAMASSSFRSWPSSVPSSRSSPASLPQTKSCAAGEKPRQRSGALRAHCTRLVQLRLEALKKRTSPSKEHTARETPSLENLELLDLSQELVAFNVRIFNRL